MTTSINPPTAIELANGLRTGAATIVAAKTNLDVFSCDCLQESGAWPDTELEIAYGDWSCDLPVWLVASWVRGAHPALRDGDWDVSVSDGQFRGFRGPTVEGDDEDGWRVVLHGGDNLALDISLSATSEAEANEAAETIGDALQDAYDEISVPEPAEEDIVAYLSDERPVATVYIDERNQLDTTRGSADGPHVEVRQARVLNSYIYSLTPSWGAAAQARLDGESALNAARNMLLDWLEDPADERDVARGALLAWNDDDADEADIAALFRALYERDPDDDDAVSLICGATAGTLSAEEAARVLAVLGDDWLDDARQRIGQQDLRPLVPEED